MDNSFKPSTSERINISETIESHLKKIDKQISTKLAMQTTKLNTKIEKIEDEMKDFKNATLEEIANLNSKFQSLNIEKILESFKIDIKKEINDEISRPLEYELKENFKTMNLLDQQIKVQSWNIESSFKEFNCRFEVHREKICKIENIATEFAKEANQIVINEIEQIKKYMKKAKEKIKKVYWNFSFEKDDLIKEMKDKDLEREVEHNNAVQNIVKYKQDIEKITKGLGTQSNLQMQRLDITISQFQSQMENLKCEVLISQRECYEDAKNELIKIFKKDFMTIEDKLRWLPSNMQDISNMTPIEARLYTIETRIKNEENNRIVHMNDMIKGIRNVEISGSYIKTQGKKHREKSRIEFQSARSVTPVPAATKICKSPGGMRLLTSNSNHRIMRKIENLDGSISLAKTKAL
ncbi:hypothetical protein SteCoe_28514 [Stentor coeruleus]|uniref:Uncharacterized protein n=1 Tax=Stentor coeruleus TaxID=5963 RepID=A0A1R2B832_9CILI|nr:hypothetical protein SteCoe_28514 [Stentor coeruleus]